MNCTGCLYNYAAMTRCHVLRTVISTVPIVTSTILTVTSTVLSPSFLSFPFLSFSPSLSLSLNLSLARSLKTNKLRAVCLEYCCQSVCPDLSFLRFNIPELFPLCGRISLISELKLSSYTLWSICENRIKCLS